MAIAPTSTSERNTSAGGYPQRRGVLLSAADFDALITELESLRGAVADMDGAPSGGAESQAAIAAGANDLLTALERAQVERERIEQVSTLIELASALDGVATINGGASVGSIVRVADRAGRTTEYELIARPDAGAPRQKVTLGSPVGQALLGARPGDMIRITLANGRRRRVRVLNVQPRGLASLRAVLERGAAPV